MTPSKPVIAGLAALVLVLAVACGGGDSDDSGDGSSGSAATEAPDGSGDEPEDTATSEPSGGGSASPGSATLTIGDESWTFDVFFFEFSPEETGDVTSLFSLAADGETSDGVSVRLFVDIADMTELGFGYSLNFSIEMYDFHNFSDPSIHWTAFQILMGDDRDGFLQVEGKGVTGDIEEIPGTLVATCP